MDQISSSGVRHGWALPALVALLSFVAVAAAIDPAGSYPHMPQGPGLTTDEMFNVEEGVRLVGVLPEFIIGRLTLAETFGDADERTAPGSVRPGDARREIGFHNPDHPPLGRLWLGLAHNAVRKMFPPHAHPPQFVATACARVGSAAAFAALVFLVGWFATRWYGRLAGFTAALALVLMPRLFGHAHLAALETVTNFIWCAALFSVAHWWRTESPPTWKSAALTGVLFGLALLTKIQAILLPVPIALWAFWHWRTRAIVPLAVWSLTGLAVFFVGWPWLWLSPVDHLVEYFGRTMGRQTLFVYYFGERYADVDVPWHYPAVLFLTTLPVGLLLLGLIGLGASEESRAESQESEGQGRRQSFRLSTLVSRLSTVRQPREQLLLAGLLFPLILFALHGVAVYDGARLFLVVFPLWAVFASRGAAIAFDWLRRKLTLHPAVAASAVLLALQAVGVWTVQPAYLNYYNLLVGGLPGAERLGLELDYWGDGLTRELLEETARVVPAGSTIAFFPVLHNFVTDDLERQSPTLREKRIRLRPWTNSETTRPRYVLLYRRRADRPGQPMFDPPTTDARRIAVIQRQGVPLAALFEFP